MSREGLSMLATSRLAWRNLWRNHRRTLIMLGAIAVGVWAMIFMAALMRGMVDEMVAQGIRNLPGHVQVHHPDYRDDPNIQNSMSMPHAMSESSLLRALNQAPTTAWAARLRVPAMISSERDSRGLTLLGVNPKQEVAIGFDLTTLKQGRFLKGPDDKGLIIGRKMLERLETELGKRVVLMSQDPGNSISDRGFRIVGVYTSRLEGQEELYAWTGLTTAQAFLNSPGAISEIAVVGNDYRNTEPLFEHINHAAGDGLSIQAWQDIDPYLSSTLKFMDGFVLIWIVIVFMALGFGLVNTLMMAVFERIREFGLLQALGMKPAAIVKLVLAESLMLLLLGLVAGNVLAVSTIMPLSGGIDVSAVAKGMEMGGMSSVLYPALKWPDLIRANLIVIALGLVTSLLPAWRASQYRPVEAIAKN